MPELVGPVVYRRSPEDLAGTYLAPFELVRIPIELTAQERFDYAQAEAVYRDFLAKHRLPMRSPEDWQRFIMVASTSHSGGREALLAARQRREIREGAMRKGATLETLLHEMVHQWQYEEGLPVDHGARFRSKAREVGIEPAATRAPGGLLRAARDFLSAARYEMFAACDGD